MTTMKVLRGEEKPVACPSDRKRTYFFITVFLLLVLWIEFSLQYSSLSE